MINFILKNVIRKAVIKLATDKNLRGNIQRVAKNAHELHNQGKLIKTLGKNVGKIKNRIKKKFET